MSDPCNPMDCNLPGSSVNGILQARILEWVAISISRRSSQEDLALISKESNLGKPQLGLYGPLLAKSMLFNMLSSFVIVFLPRVKRLLLSWLQSLLAVILDPKKRKCVTDSTFCPSVCHEMMGVDVINLLSSQFFFFFTLLFQPQEAL